MTINILFSPKTAINSMPIVVYSTTKVGIPNLPICLLRIPIGPGSELALI